MSPPEETYKAVMRTAGLSAHYWRTMTLFLHWWWAVRRSLGPAFPRETPTNGEKERVRQVRPTGQVLSLAESHYSQPQSFLSLMSRERFGAQETLAVRTLGGRIRPGACRRVTDISSSTCTISFSLSWPSAPATAGKREKEKEIVDEEVCYGRRPIVAFLRLRLPWRLSGGPTVWGAEPWACWRVNFASGPPL